MTMKENQNAASFDLESYTDKNVMECDLPELKICYKDIDCQILKDICVDEGRPERDINMIESFTDEKPGILFPEPPIDKVHLEAPEDSQLECGDDHSANQCGSKEENDGEILVSEGNLESSSDNTFDEVSSKHRDPEKLEQAVEANCGASATGKAETDSSEMDSLMVKTEDFCEPNNISQPPDQVLVTKEGLVSKGNLESSLDNSLDEVPSKHPDPEKSEQAVEAKCGASAAGEAETDKDNGVIASVEEQPAESADAAVTENSDGGSATSSNQHVGSENSSGETSHDKSPESKDATSRDDSSNENASSKNGLQVLEPKAPEHELGNSSGRASVVSQLYRDEGETSFSAASLVNYSEPIAFSGSLSHRSDGSTASAKSFAFPVLQSEWNSSPVRMAKADRRDFRKNKTWRSGILCCKF